MPRANPRSSRFLPPSDEQVWEVLERIIKRVMTQLVRRGILVEDQGEMYLADVDDDSEEARTLRLLHRGSCVYCHGRCKNPQTAGLGPSKDPRHRSKRKRYLP
jgi:hypothetical protein